MKARRKTRRTKLSKLTRRLRLDPRILIPMFQAQESPRYYSITKNPLPSDAVVVNVKLEHTSNGLIMDLIIESEEFIEDTPNPLSPVEITQMVAITAASIFKTGE